MTLVPGLEGTSKYHKVKPSGIWQGRKTFGNLEPGSPNAIFEFQEFEMQFLEAIFLLGQLK